MNYVHVVTCNSTPVYAGRYAEAVSWIAKEIKSPVSDVAAWLKEVGTVVNLDDTKTYALKRVPCGGVK